MNPHIECLFFVNLGCVLVNIKKDILNVLRMDFFPLFSFISFVLYIIICFILSLLSTSRYISEADLVSILLIKILILLGIGGLFGLVYCNISLLWKLPIKIFYKYSFYTYLFHMLIVHIIRNISSCFFVRYALLNYSIVVIFTLLLSVIFYRLTNKLFPKFLYILVGFRI